MGTQVVPHSKATTEGAQDALKAPWTLRASVGRGFDRLTCQYKNTAVFGTQTPMLSEVLSNRTSADIRVAESHEEHARAFFSSTTASFAGWGASVSASAQYATASNHSHTSVTALINFEFLSEPHIALEPTLKESDAALRPEALELLSEEGPVKFHEVYGTHYVKGYVTGGAMRGHYQATYRTAMQARRASIELTAAVTSVNGSASGSAMVDSRMSRTEGYQTKDIDFRTIGWSSRTPPKDGLTVESMVAAKEGFDLHGGEKFEAILGFYTDFPAYKEAIEEYEASGGTEVYKDIDLDLYQRAAQVLNYEVLAAEYIVKRLRKRENAWPNFRSYARDPPRFSAEAEVRIEDIKEAFGYGDDAQENWAAFLDYIDWYRRSDVRLKSAEDAADARPSGTDLEKFPLAAAGYELSYELFDRNRLLNKTQNLLRYEVLHTTRVKAEWVRSGGDGFKEKNAEVEGHASVQWAVNEPGKDKPKSSARLTFRRQRHRTHRRFGKKPELLLDWSSGKIDKIPREIEFRPKEDDGKNSQDDYLGVKRIRIDYGGDAPVHKYTELQSDAHHRVYHEKDKFGFNFAVSVKRSINKDPRI